MIDNILKSSTTTVNTREFIELIDSYKELNEVIEKRAILFEFDNNNFDFLIPKKIKLLNIKKVVKDLLKIIRILEKRNNLALQTIRELDRRNSYLEATLNSIPDKIKRKYIKNRDSLEVKKV